ncbi:hypothetical protein RAD16_32425 [Bradyrhizobium sp. 18BD]
MSHKVELVLRVDGADVETLAFTGEPVRASIERNQAGLIVAVFSAGDDGDPPAMLTRGGAGGHPGMHTAVVRKVPVGEEKRWRLVRAVGWRKDD